MKGEESIVPDEIVQTKIYKIRGQKVLIDRDLATLYGVETKYLKRQVKRNEKRFPIDFMFQLTKDEFENWRRQFVTSKSDKQGLRYAPYVFTEQGVAMLSGVLNSERAINVNIQIMRIFCKMREMLMSQKDLLLRLEKFENKLENHDEKLNMLYKHLKEIFEEREQEETQSNRRKIGYKSEEEE